MNNSKKTLRAAHRWSLIATAICNLVAWSPDATAQGVLRIEAANVEEAKDAAPQPTPAAAAPALKTPAASPPANILERPVLVPALYPNPVAFNVNWLGIKPKDAFAAARVLARKRQVAQRRIAPAPALAVAGRPAVNQKQIEQQMRKFLEPMVKAEISFASRAADLEAPERQKLITSAKQWFETYLKDFINKQDPNQQQMLLQGVQGVWFGGGQQKPQDPRDWIREGVAKIAASALPKEKAAVYKEECRKREEFARQVAVDNLVERLDEKVRLSPDQWKKITESLAKNWDKKRDPQLEAFAMNYSMWPGAPDQVVLPELSPAQQAVLKRINGRAGHVWFGGGILGRLFGVEGGIIDDVDADFGVQVEAEAVEGAPVQENPFE